MKYTVYLTCLIIFISSKLFGQAEYQFQNFSIGPTSNDAFTSNNFKCIGVGKGNLIWAGTQYGGLYTYSSTHNIWTKSTKLTNVFINDIKADPDSGIWIAQSGTASGAVHSNLAGGVNYFPNATDATMNFYTVTDNSVSSRNAKSIYIDTAYRLEQGELPRPWVAFGTYINNTTTVRGGVNVGVNPIAPFFSNIPWGFAILGTPQHICESIGGNSQEVWVGSRLNQGGSKIVRYTPDKQFIGHISDANTPTFAAGFSPQAIFFDSRRDKWVGLKQGGLRVLKDGQWYAMYNPLFFDVNTQVNFNAIAEDEFGNVFIGTTGGLLMYESPAWNTSSFPDRVSSYKLITTTDGLINNNVTGLAYDGKTGKLLITTAGGVSFLKLRYPFIHGKILDAYTGIDGVNATTAGLKTKPFEILGRVRAILYKDGVEKETVLPEADGNFTLKLAEENTSYTVEVRHNFPDATIRYIYEDVRNHSRIQPSLFPITLIQEIKEMKAKLEKRCFPMKVYFGFETPAVFCTGNAFRTTGYDMAYQWAFNPEGIKTDHAKHINNLANYYASLGTVYNLGGQYAEMVGETVAVFADLIEAVGGEFIKKDAVEKSALQKIYDDSYEHFLNAVTSLKEGVVWSANKLLVFVTKEDQKKLLERIITSINEATDLLLEYMKEGKGKDAAMKAALDNIKKLFAQTMAITLYQESYAKTRHDYFVPQVSQAAGNLQSGMSYAEGFDQLYNLNTPSLVKVSTDTVAAAKVVMSTLSNASKLADGVSNGLNFVSYIGLIPGGQALAAAARAASYASKAIKYFTLLGSIYQGAVTVSDVAELSDKIREKVQLRVPGNGENTSYSNVAVETSVDSLMARKNRYNSKLSELQLIYAAPTFNESAFLSKRLQLKLEDSLFSAELRNVMNSIFSVADTANEVIANFGPRYNRIMDTFVDLQMSLKQAYFYRNMAFFAESDKSIDRAGIDSVVSELKITNDSLVNGLQSIAGDVNAGSINAKAFLVREGYTTNFNRVPGTNGSVTYRFKNFGGEPQNNVSFKITDLTNGYTILGADSVNVGTILPGQTKSVTFSFKSPLHDSLSKYRIQVKAGNGRFQDETGSFYTYDPSKCFSAKDGNWNSPATWVCGVVPGPNTPVVIAHKVTVTAAASCKNVALYSPGELKVQPGVQFNVTH